MAYSDTAVIYWLSGTGNSLVVAKALASSLGNADMRPLAQGPVEPGPQGVPVGVVFPVHAFGLPSLVAHFLERVPLTPGAFVFTVATAAAVPGSAHRQAAAILASRGMDLAAGWTVRMPLSFSPVPIPCSQRRRDALLSRADQRVTAIAAAVRERRRGSREDSSRLLAWSLRGLHGGAMRFLPWADRYFSVLSRCSACGLCARVCPVGNITFDENSRPAWHGRCEACYACMQWCPVEAIRCGGPLPNKQRYRHPSVRAEEIATQSPRGDESEAPQA